MVNYESHHDNYTNNSKWKCNYVNYIIFTGKIQLHADVLFAHCLYTLFCNKHVKKEILVQVGRGKVIKIRTEIKNKVTKLYV